VLVDTQTPVEDPLVELEVLAVEEEKPLDLPTAREIDDELKQRDEDYERAPLQQLCRVLFWVTSGALGLFLTVGWPYYKLPIMGRPFHHYYDALRPSGSLGLMLGIVGTFLMAVSLLYLVRKRYASWARFGSLQNWMGFHVLTSLTGVALVVFHANFIPYSAIGIVAFSSMATVVVTGFLGRYIYLHVPHSLRGRELEVEDLRKRLSVYRKKLVDLEVKPSLLKIDVDETAERRSLWILPAIQRFVFGDRESREKFERLRDAVCAEKDRSDDTKRVLRLVKRLCRERQWLVRHRELRSLPGAWRFLHRWLAIVIFAVIFCHVFIATKFGGLWIFGGRG
jgi:hypothetical protein